MKRLPSFNSNLMKNFVLCFASLAVFFLGNVLQADAYIFGDWQEGEEDLSMGDVFLEGRFLDSNLILVSVIVEDMRAPVLGIAFHLDYDAKALAFLRYDPGDFLETGGDPFYLVSNDELKEKIFFGETLRREDNFPLGGGKVADFYFQILEEGEFSFEFENAVISTLDVVRQDISNISWNDLLTSRESAPSIQDVEGLSDGNEQLKDSVLSIRLDYLLIGILIISFLAGSAILLIRKRKNAPTHEGLSESSS